MRKAKWSLMLLILALLSLCLIVHAEGIPGITLNETKVSVHKGARIRLEAELSNISEKYITAWDSSDPGIASVDQGTVIGVSAGSATIKCCVTLHDGTVLLAECIVEVLIPVTRISAEERSITAFVGKESPPIALTISPEDASDASVSWISEDEKIATIDSKGRITGVSVGRTKVIATANDGSGKMIQIPIRVMRSVESISLDYTEITIGRGKRVILNSVLLPENATEKRLTWTSSDKSVANVSKGTVTGVKQGAAIITAEATDGSNVSASCKVVVIEQVAQIKIEKPDSVLMDNTQLQLVTSVLPENATKPALQWSSSDPSIASVNEEGIVTGHSEGTVTITAMSTDGSNKTDSIQLTLEHAITPIKTVTLDGGMEHVVALLPDGTVVADGENDLGQCNVRDWKDIVSIGAGYYYSAGLKANGTVVTTKNKQVKLDTGNWDHIVAIAAGSQHLVGLKEDGTVVATGINEYGQCNVSEWKDIVDIAVGGWHTLGLKSDGTVISCGYNKYGQRNVSDWKNIISVDGGNSISVGLTEDGHAVFAGGYDDDDKRLLKKLLTWSDLIKLDCSGGEYVFGIKNDHSFVDIYSGGRDRKNVIAYARVPWKNYTALLSSNGVVSSQYEKIDKLTLAIPKERAIPDTNLAEKGVESQGIWTLKRYRDEFDRETDEYYTVNGMPFKGIYTRNGEKGTLSAYLFFNLSTLQGYGIFESVHIRLFENETDRVINTSSDIKQYTILFMDQNENTTQLLGEVFSGSSDIGISLNGDELVTEALKKGGKVGFSLTENDYPYRHYVFWIDEADGFDVVYRELYSLFKGV